MIDIVIVVDVMISSIVLMLLRVINKLAVIRGIKL